MILDQTKLLFRLCYRPLDAMSGILDHGSWIYGAVAVAVVSVSLQVATSFQLDYALRAWMAHQPPPPVGQATPSNGSRVLAGSNDEEYDEPALPDPATGRRPVPPRSPELLGRMAAPAARALSMFSPGFSTLFALALLYVPLLIVLMTVLAPIGSIGVALRRDYGGLLACTLMAWTAAHLPFVIAGLALISVPIGFIGMSALWGGGTVAFGLLMVFALRTVFGASYGRSIAAVCLSPIAVMLEMMVVLASGALWMIASPCILYMVYSYFRGNLGDLGSSFRHRQSFRHNLEVCTINPRDAEAHYQLGLIHQQRHQYTEAISRFRQAIEIDPNELDAHFQLGRIAREQGRPQEALDHFGQVISRDDKHSQSEIWREIGATYEVASMWEDAHQALERFIERRPFDAEGLYRMASVAGKLNQSEKSREMLERCVEAVKTMPYYRRGEVRKWGKLAQKGMQESGS